MRMWRLHEVGEPIDKLVMDDVPEPSAGPGELLVATEAAGISFPEVLMCRGTYQVRTPIPFQPGRETAGRVLAVGEGVTSHQHGDRVLWIGGGLAERHVVAASAVWSIPDQVSSPKAAAIPVNYGTTYYALHDRGHLVAGQTLLVTGAAGGTGSSAIQLGRAAGARVIAVAGGPDKAARCRDLGADVVIDHQETPEWVDLVKDATGGTGVELAYDPVGGDTFHQVRRCMAWGGRLLVVGFVAGIPDIPANHVLLKSYDVVGVHWGASLGRDPGALGRTMTTLLDLAGSGVVDPLVYPPYPFEQGARALQDLADRKPYGKPVVLGTGDT